jgi:hypothetical protein
MDFTPSPTLAHASLPLFAGPAAILIAKTIKIGDRLDDASRGDLKRIVDKTHSTSSGCCRPVRLPNSAQGSLVTGLTPRHMQMLSAA